MTASPPPVSTIRLTVNGVPHDVPLAITLAALLERLELRTRFLAVERNQRVVPRALHPETILEADDQLEIVTLVGGG